MSRISKEQEARMRALYDKGESDQNIAEGLGMSKSAVYQWRRARGLPSNQRGTVPMGASELGEEELEEGDPSAPSGHLPLKGEASPAPPLAPLSRGAGSPPGLTEGCLPDAGPAALPEVYGAIETVLGTVPEDASAHTKQCAFNYVASMFNRYVVEKIGLRKAGAADAAGDG